MKLPVALLSVLLLFTSYGEAEGERVRIAVLGLFHARELSVEAAPGQSLILTAGNREFVVGDESQRRVALLCSGHHVLIEAAGQRISADSVRLAGYGANSDFVLTVPHKLHRLYHGQLAVRSIRGELVPVLETDLETAVASTVAAES